MCSPGVWRPGGRVRCTRRAAAPPPSPPASPWRTQSPGRGAGLISCRTPGEQGAHVDTSLIGLIVGLIAYGLIFGLIGLAVSKVSRA